jgi:hypothetical protein
MANNLMGTLKSLAADGIPLNFASSTTLSTSQQWVLAVGALLNAKEGYAMNTLTTGFNNSLLQDGLKSVWGINNREEFLTQAQRLSSMPNQAEYELIWGEMRKFIDPSNGPSKGGFGKFIGSVTAFFGVSNPLQMAESMKVLKGKTSETDQELAIKLNNSMQWLTEFEGMGIDAKKINNLMIWDASRLINVARWANQVGWITEAEFFNICTPLAKQVQSTYASWQNMLDASFAASMMWNYDENRLEGFKVAHKQLLKDPASPFKALPWNTLL